MVEVVSHVTPTEFVDDLLARGLSPKEIALRLAQVMFTKGTVGVDSSEYTKDYTEYLKKLQTDCDARDGNSQEITDEQLKYPFGMPYSGRIGKAFRNQPCICGSGVKYKKCCIRREK